MTAAAVRPIASTGARVDGHVDGVASTGASTGASMRSVGASAGMCRAALPSPRLPAQLPRAPPRASPLPPAEEHAWVSRCCVVPPLLRCWAAGVAGAARLAVMPRAALQALGGVGGRRYSASCGAARFSVRALPTARWRRGGVRGVRSQGDCRCKVATLALTLTLARRVTSASRRSACCTTTRAALAAAPAARCGGGASPRRLRALGRAALLLPAAHERDARRRAPPPALPVLTPTPTLTLALALTTSPSH